MTDFCGWRVPHRPHTEPDDEGGMFQCRGVEDVPADLGPAAPRDDDKEPAR